MWHLPLASSTLIDQSQKTNLSLNLHNHSQIHLIDGAYILHDLMGQVSHQLPLVIQLDNLSRSWGGLSSCAFLPTIGACTCCASLSAIASICRVSEAVCFSSC